MTTMYQTVDDAEDTGEDAAPRRRRVRPLFIALILAGSVSIALWFASQPKGPNPSQTQDALLAERASYRTAISETEADLRRARLRDFAAMHPESRMLRAAKAQLAVLDTHEARDWAKMSDVMFEPANGRAEKLAALQNYEAAWGSSYLGGREDDIRELRSGLEEDPAPLPDRELKDGKSPIPKNVPDTVMVGGPRAALPPRPAPVQPRPAPAPVVRTLEARVKKNVSPRYPRRAQRREINAVVVLSLSVDNEGEVQRTEVISAQAEKYTKDFIKAAERAALRTRYHPKTENGKAVPTQGVLKRYVFKIK